MESFIKNRLSDRRFGNTRPVDTGGAWYKAPAREPVAGFAARHNASKSDADSTKATKGDKRERNNGSDTSDNSDQGECWSVRS
tara:strand:+ start:123 stop:371 length:249 start_codon:yes stop_codon:yes gene_type:complete